MSTYASRLAALREVIAAAQDLRVNAIQKDAEMTSLLKRIEELAGAVVAKAIQAEFGGVALYIPGNGCAPMFGRGCEQAVKVAPTADAAPPPLRLVLSVEVHPNATLAGAKSAVAEAVTHMQAAGVHVRDIGVDMRGMGSALADALRGEPTIGGHIAPIAGTGAAK